MATFTEATIQQGTAEVRKWTADYTDDLPTGVTVSSGTAVHIPPSGTAGTISIATTSTTVTAQVGPLSVTGQHYIDILATYSNGEKSSVRIAFTVNYPSTTAREGMLTLIDTVRAYADCGANDYSIAGVPYWSDAQLQTVLDRHKTWHNMAPTEGQNIYTSAGTTGYLDYHSNLANWESGTAVFKITDSIGSAAPSYTMDYARGVITFAANTSGSSYYITGNTYDLYAAAADIWRMKASQAAKLYTFSTDNHTINRGEWVKNCMQMANLYAGMAGPTCITIERGDM